MNLVIVEKEEAAVKKLRRILRLIDPSIIIVQTVDKIETASIGMQSNSSADHILVEHTLLTNTGIQQRHIQGKLTLRTRQYTFTYLFVQAQAFQQWQPAPNSKGEISEATPAKNQIESSADLQRPTQDYLGIPTIFKNRLFVGSGKTLVSVAEDKIAYFVSEGRLVYLTTFEKNKYALRYRMDELQQFLNPEQFYRINRSHMISIKSIEQINPHFGGRLKLQLTPCITGDILVSRKRAAGFKIWLGK